ncbi:MAG: DUF937 domain-containing protein [Bacteroidetes bacterium]|nr:MAG: DUF937 domain-containing protein [Bacteroidota bacterium]
MLDQLLNLVKEHAGDAIVNNPAIPNQHNDEAINMASSSIFDALKGQASGGGIGNLISMFSGGGASASSNPLVSGVVSNLASQYAQKFGISPAIANTVASSLIPMVMEKFVNKTNDPKDSSFDLNGIVGTLTGKGGSDIASLIGQFTGGGQAQPAAAGGLGGLIGKFFGK